MLCGVFCSHLPLPGRRPQEKRGSRPMFPTQSCPQNVPGKEGPLSPVFERHHAGHSDEPWALPSRDASLLGSRSHLHGAKCVQKQGTAVLPFPGRFGGRTVSGTWDGCRTSPGGASWQGETGTVLNQERNHAKEELRREGM